MLICPGSNSETIIYNTFTDSSATINEKWRDYFLENCPAPEESDTIEKAVAAGFIVPDRKYEERAVSDWLRRKSESTEELYLIILTTYACNLKCVYCYEDGIKNKGSMDIETANRVKEWVCARLERVPFKRLIVSFYGGEPLLNPQIIRFLTRELSEEARKRGIIPEFDILTNGVLLDEGLITELAGFGLEAIKVTLDGSREFHDEKRTFKNREGTFDVIVENLLKINGKIRINIGANFDRRNIEGIPLLLDYLSEVGLKEGISQVGFKPILMHDHCMGCLTSPSCAPRQMLQLYDETLKRGFRPRNILELGPCELYKCHAAAIDPVGAIYSCGGFVGREEGLIGHISGPDPYPEQGIGEKPRVIHGLRNGLIKDCVDCLYLPLCGGGCRFSSNSCQKGYFEHVSTELIQRRLKAN